MEEFQHCPICLEVPEREIYQCFEGHVICATCLSKVSGARCPQCRVKFGKPKIRSRILERILDSRQFVCKFKDKGCPHLCKREEITNHANSCSYNPNTHPLCEQLKLKDCSDFRIGCVSRSDVIAHYRDVHKLALRISPDLFIKGDFIKHWWNRKRKVGEAESEELRVRSFLAGLLTPKDSDTSPLFLLFGRFGMFSGNMSFLCINVWELESQPRKKYKAQFVLQKDSTAQTPSSSSSCIDPFPIDGSMKVCSIKEARYLVNESPINFRILMLLLGRFGDSIKDGIKIKITEISDITLAPEGQQNSSSPP